MSERSRAPSNDAIDKPPVTAATVPIKAAYPNAPTATNTEANLSPPKKPARRLDPVIQALARCEQILNELDPPEADRVLDWLMDKYGTPKRPLTEFRD